MVRRGSGAALAVLMSAGLLAGCQNAPVETASAPASGTAATVAVPSSARAPAPAAKLMLGAAWEPAPDTSRFPDVPPHGWQVTQEAPVSTFSLDVDTASYAYVRRALRDGRRPPPQAVRVEEMVNYFSYDYPAPSQREDVLRLTATVTPSPWKEGAKLLHLGLKGWDVARTTRPRANLTFLVDVSGSMAPEDRLPLIKKALRLLGEGLRPDDKVAIVTYAGASTVALPPTSAAELPRILAAVDGLGAGGGTAGAQGIRTAYDLAQGMYDRDAVNRVVLATDGDFNVGVTDGRSLEAMIADKRQSGIYLTVVGVGVGNLNDALMQRLAQAGNGQAAYLDSILEARKLWVEQLGASMVPLADDAKIQVEFNPRQVAEYRLVGYETRALARADFANDRVDAGDIGSGHSVTALYEFIPTGSPARLTEPLRYGKTAAAATDDNKTALEYAFVKLRAKLPGATTSRQSSWPVGRGDEVTVLRHASDDVRFSVAVAGFAQMLRGEWAVTPAQWDDTIALAEGARGADPNGWRAEAVQLMRVARDLR